MSIKRLLEKGTKIRHNATIGAPVIKKKARRPSGVQIRSPIMPTTGWAMKPKAGLMARMSAMIHASSVNSRMVSGSTTLEVNSVTIRPVQTALKAMKRGRRALLRAVGEGVGSTEI